jgi:asparagine synthase (glutamine-hydrolysing)
MSDAIAHRGPDGEGFIAINTRLGRITELGGPKTPVPVPPLNEFRTNADLYLAHRRLSILDLSAAGHQPMSNREKDIWVTFNGEIYNYKSLRNELREFDFKSNTDTEVLLYAYQKWGVHCLDHFNGMWAFVIYDAKKKILFGARDRFGVKPLYYTQNTKFFAFNSEIKGLLAMSGASKKINADVSSAYLRLGQDSFQGETFFETISELQPSCLFVYDISKENLTVEKYYELPFNDNWERFDDGKCAKFIEGVRDRILNAVDLRLNADVTVGSCLSGGMDSSAIVCSINKLLEDKPYHSLGAKQGVVTACYENSPLDESKWAKIVADTAQAEWHRVFPKRDELLADLNDLIYSQDVPFGSTSIYAQYRVMKTAKEAGITVMLDGQGGDELFTGYTPYYYAYYDEARRNADFALLAEEQQYVHNTPLGNSNVEKLTVKNKLKAFIKRYLPDNAKNFFRQMLHSQLESRYVQFVGKRYKQHAYSTLNQMLFAYMSFTSLPTLLKYEDRNSMRFSIESRTPFADDINLIEYVFSIPGVYKIHHGWSKYLLRRSMDSFAPAQIISRVDKIGFATPEYEWLAAIKPFIFDDISPDINSLLNIRMMEKNWDKIFAAQNKSGVTNIWRYINFILWSKLYKVAF